MIKNKKGLSIVVTTLIIVLLVLVAIGIIWVVIKNVIDEGAAQVDLTAKCLKIDVKAVSANCADPTACELTLNRGSGGEEIDGVKIVFYDGTIGGPVLATTGNLEVLGTLRFDEANANAIDSGFVLPTIPDKVKISAYFTDESGNEQICSQATTFNF